MARGRRDGVPKVSDKTRNPDRSPEVGRFLGFKDDNGGRGGAGPCAHHKPPEQFGESVSTLARREAGNMRFGVQAVSHLAQSQGSTRSSVGQDVTRPYLYLPTPLS